MQDQDPSDDAFVAVLRRDGVIRTADAIVTPLTGGVSSEIYRVQDGGETFVVKRALAKLKVRDDWFADVARNRYEQLYMTYVAKFLPEAVPAIRNADPDRGYFVMEYLDPDYRNWKQLLLDGRCDPAHAQLAGQILGQIHKHSAGDAEADRLFNTTANFHQLRLEPYLLTTGQRHPDLRPLFEAEARRLATTRLCLVHGDFSPKNILIKGQRMVLLDCEVAWYGDPAFDAAFLLNHLLLKSLYHAPRDRGLGAMVKTFWRHYSQAVGATFGKADLETRITRLLLMLLLARVDGKSPAEYLTDEPRKQLIRQFVRAQLPAESFSLSNLTKAWFSGLNTMETPK
jgi:5-methylthioribose kinase